MEVNAYMGVNAFKGEKIGMEKHIYIAGAHSRGQTFNEYVTFLYPETSVESYLVDDLSENDTAINGVAVVKIDESSGLNPDYPVYVATRGIHYGKLSAELSALGMKYIYHVDEELDRKLRNAYVKRVFASQNREFCKLDAGPSAEIPRACIYVAATAFDRKLRTEYTLMPDEGIIQAGAALSGQRLANAAAYDNEGENISYRNKQFCELTALYWIWKNAKQEIVGLAHYRRHFLLPHNWLDWMGRHKIDVILPVPLYAAPNIEENYKKRHCADDWEFMMQYLREECPGDYDAAVKFFKTSLYSPCNMFIMRKNVLDDFCKWLFPILEAAALHGGEKTDAYQNRYPGFLSERLMTYFFDKNREKYKVAFADKNFLQ